MPTRRATPLLFKLTAIAAALALSGTSRATVHDPANASPATTPTWLTDLSLGVKESYDDNVLSVSGLGMPEQSSWVNTVSFKLGINLAPGLAAGSAIQAFTLVYQPDKAAYANDAAESYTAHRINDLFKGKIGNFSYSLDNAFVYVDGNKLAETYALNQLSGSAANQADKYRNSLAHAAPRERRNQYQDRYGAQVRWDAGSFFFRPVSSLAYYNLNTYLFNTSKAPYLGYQDYVDRWDVNGGVDFGCKIAPDLAFTLGYRDGYQHQDPFSLGINSDQHHSSNHYQRVLFGLEGNLASWLNVKLSAGPDYRDFNPNTPISDLRTTRFYGEGLATAALSKNQSLTFNFKQWVFVSSTGLVPFQETTSSLIYHWDATKRWGFDLGPKFQKHNYTLSDDLAGSAPSLREDVDYAALIGVTYAITAHLTANVTYNYEKGRNDVTGLAATYDPNYRDFEHGVVALGLKYGF